MKNVKMKIGISLLFSLVMALSIAGCGSKDGSAKRSSNSQAGVEDVPKPQESSGDAAAINAAEGIDVDLTALSSTMVYSEVYNMMDVPDNYIGKTVKMKGTFASFNDEVTGNQYFTCTIKDAAACCAQGIEFVPDDEYSYPDDYPEDNSEITVVGVFDTYEEDGYTYCTLKDASLLWD